MTFIRSELEGTFKRQTTTTTKKGEAEIKNLLQFSGLSLMEAIWLSYILWLLCARRPLAKGTNKVHNRRSSLTRPPTPRKHPTHPCPSLKQTTSTQDSLGLRQKAACGFVPLLYIFFLLRLISFWELYSVVVDFCISALLSVICWSFTHVASPHHMASHGITSRRHNSTQHPHPPFASIAIHAHFISGLSLHCGHVKFERVMYEYYHVTKV